MKKKQLTQGMDNKHLEKMPLEKKIITRITLYFIIFYKLFLINCSDKVKKKSVLF